MTVIRVLVLVRWIHFSAVFALFGSAFFWVYTGRAWLPVTAARPPYAVRTTAILLRAAAPVAAISGVAWLIGTLANMTGGFGAAINPENLRLFFFDTMFGPVWIARLVFLAIACVVILLPAGSRKWFATILTIGALLLINQAWLGHAAEGGVGTYGAVMIASYCVHTLAAAAWIGGLPPLLFALIEARGVRLHEARDRMLRLLSSYSAMAICAVTLIIASGIANASFRVGASFDLLLKTDYGDTLFTKIGLVAIMLVLASINRFWLMPRWRHAQMHGNAQIIPLRASVAAELLLGLLVIGAAAVLGITPPPQ